MFIIGFAFFGALNIQRARFGMNSPLRLEEWLPIAHVIDSFVNVVCGLAGIKVASATERVGRSDVPCPIDFRSVPSGANLNWR
jgi:hypothetical protein